MVAAIMGGSLAWWVGLSELIGRFRHRIGQRQLKVINKTAGILLVFFGVLLVAEIAGRALGINLASASPLNWGRQAF